MTGCQPPPRHRTSGSARSIEDSMRTHVKTSLPLFCALSALVSVAVPVLSQTVPASTQAPALQRPAPDPARLPDGKPNWTGFWDLPNGFLEASRGPTDVRGSGRGAGGGRAQNVLELASATVPEMKSPSRSAMKRCSNRPRPARATPALCFASRYARHDGGDLRDGDPADAEDHRHKQRVQGGDAFAERSQFEVKWFGVRG